MFLLNQELSKESVELAKRTISPNTFYMLIQHHMLNGHSISVVRMGDGEHSMWKEYKEKKGSELSSVFTQKDRERLGIEGITVKELGERLAEAAAGADYFCPSISGLHHEAYYCHDIGLGKFDKDKRTLVDNFYNNLWSREQMMHLYKLAGKILIVSRYPGVFANFERLLKPHDVKVTYLKLDGWLDTENMIKEARTHPARLVLGSFGPASKYAIIELAKQGRIVLDCGNSIGHWNFVNPDADTRVELAIKREREETAVLAAHLGFDNLAQTLRAKS